MEPSTFESSSESSSEFGLTKKQQFKQARNNDDLVAIENLMAIGVIPSFQDVVYACKKGKHQLFDLFAKGYDVSTHLDSLFLEACAGGDICMVETLQQLGANIHARDLYGRSGLHIAALTNGTDIISFLLEHGVEQTPANDNNTPLHMACISSNRDIVRILFQYGAKATINNVFQTPGDFTSDPIIVKMLEQSNEPCIRKQALAMIRKDKETKWDEWQTQRRDRIQERS